MAVRPEGASDQAVSADALRLLGPETDLVITANGVDHLMYAYIDLFYCVQNGPRHSAEFWVDGRLRGLFEVVHACFISGRREDRDPFLEAQYGASKSAWGESRWLYWTDQGTPTSSGKNRIWFVPTDSLHAVEPRKDVVVLFVGRGLSPETFPWTVETMLPDIDTSPWTVHSDSKSLYDFVRSVGEYCNVLLFHDFSNRLKRFIRDRGIQAKVITREPLPLC
jgi:hypothetical protein